MSSLSFAGFAVADDSETHSRITDFSLITVDGVTRLFSTTRYDGVVQQWNIGTGQITLGDSIGFDGPLQVGGVSGMVGVTPDTLLTGGGAGGDLQLLALNPDGGFASPQTLTSLPAIMDGLQHATRLTLPDGTVAVFGALAGSAGIARLRFDAAGNLLDHAILQDPTGDTVSGITGTSHTTVGGQAFLLSISSVYNGITSRSIDSDGGLSNAQSIGTQDGLWINAPTALATAHVGAQTFAIIASANTDSLSVVEVAGDGSMIVRDHVMDSRDTRFGGVTAIEIVESDGKTYVIAGGADDGISVFLLLEGGLLVHRDRIADTVDVSLDNISAIAAQHRAAGLDIFVASSSEAGVTQLRFDTGTTGVTATATLAGGVLTGTTGNDILQGHNGDDVIEAGAGDDILRDGAGQDWLQGGAGADVFIFAADGETDRVMDFQAGVDRLDLSLWPMLRDISQLTMTARSDGMQITYGDETLIVLSADGAPIDYRMLDNGDVIGVSRLPVNLTPGYPGPATPVDTGTPSPVPDQGGPNSVLTPLQVIAAHNLDILRGNLGGQGTGASGLDLHGQAQADIIAGGGGFDLITAGGGDDRANGSDGDDILFGRAGDDTLLGEAGADALMGGAGNDSLFGGDGQDLLQGGSSDDLLEGGFGDDILIGGAGADTFVFNAGDDLIADHVTGQDQILLDARLWTGLTSAADLLLFYGSVDETGALISFESGDTLRIEGITDLAQLADDITLF